MATRWYSVNGYKPLSRRENLEQDDLSQKNEKLLFAMQTLKMICDGKTDSFGILILNNMNRYYYKVKTFATNPLMLYPIEIAIYKIA